MRWASQNANALVTSTARPRRGNRTRPLSCQAQDTRRRLNCAACTRHALRYEGHSRTTPPSLPAPHPRALPLDPSATLLVLNSKSPRPTAHANDQDDSPPRTPDRPQSGQRRAGGAGESGDGRGEHDGRPAALTTYRATQQCGRRLHGANAPRRHLSRGELLWTCPWTLAGGARGTRRSGRVRVAQGGPGTVCTALRPSQRPARLAVGTPCARACTRSLVSGTYKVIYPSPRPAAIPLPRLHDKTARPPPRATLRHDAILGRNTRDQQSVDAPKHGETALTARCGVSRAFACVHWRLTDYVATDGARRGGWRTEHPGCVRLVQMHYKPLRAGCSATRRSWTTS